DSVRALLAGAAPQWDGQTPLSFLLQSSWGIIAFFLLVLLLKVFSMSLTNAGGGVGGTFGPTLFVGAITGFLVSRVLNQGFGAGVPEANFVLVGMAGLMAGVMQAPMTAIFLIAEISGGYSLFIPLILTASISFGCVRIFEKYSIYTKRIAQSGDLLTHDSDQAVLTLLKTMDLVRDKYPRVRPDWTLREMVDVVSSSTAAVYPVVDEEDRFQGLIEMDTLRAYILRSDQYDSLHVYNLMSEPVDFVYTDEKMDSVMAKFDKTEAWRLPVVTRENVYMGFISKSRILSAYREELKEITSQDV
ncbi:MAG: chloride channel protein, partial [Bacteroidales bacterium]|nr:chloride channel protein [Bacteroidales bacterium]